MDTDPARSGPDRQPFTAWAIDAVLVGSIAGPVVPFTFVATAAFFYPPPSPRPHQWLILLVLPIVFSAGSAVLALAAVAPIVALTRASWRWSRLASFAIGPVLGGTIGIPFAALVGIRALLDVRWEDPWLISLGAVCATPPWCAYLVVIDRGRSGRWVALAAPVWVAAVVLFAQLALIGVLRAL